MCVVGRRVKIHITARQRLYFLSLTPFSFCVVLCIFWSTFNTLKRGWGHFCGAFQAKTPTKGSSSGTGDRQSASFQSKHIIMLRTAIIISGMWRNRSEGEQGRCTIAEAPLIFVFQIEIKLRQPSKKEFNGTIKKSMALFCCAQTDSECQDMSRSKYTPCFYISTHVHLNHTSGCFQGLHSVPQRPVL